MIKQCLICKKNFHTTPSKINDGCGKYCSRRCFLITCKGRDLSKNFGKIIYRSGEKHWNWKGGFDSHKNGYIFIYMPEHPFAAKSGYIPAHRYLAEAYLGRFLNPREIIHHIDGNPHNNSPENLYLFCSNSAHSTFHNSPFKLKSNIIH